MSRLFHRAFSLVSSLAFEALVAAVLLVALICSISNFILFNNLNISSNQMELTLNGSSEPNPDVIDESC